MPVLDNIFLDICVCGLVTFKKKSAILLIPQIWNLLISYNKTV